MNLHDQSIALLIFFPVLTTITVGVRVFVRTRLCKGAFGWDDVLLLVTTIGLLLWVALDWKALDAGYGTKKFTMYTAARDDVCYIISGAVKVSVALVLYKLDMRTCMRMIIVADIVVCIIWTIVVTVILGIGCTDNSPMRMRQATCAATNYAQEASYVVFNVLHLIIPINMTWGVKVRGGLKWAVIALFSVGLLAAFAAIMKLRVVLAIFRTGPTPTLWYEAQIWALAEHGLSLFAAAVLAIRPIFAYVSSSLVSVASTIRSKSVSLSSGNSGVGGANDGGTGTTATRMNISGARTRKLVGWWIQPFKPLLFKPLSFGGGDSVRGRGSHREAGAAMGSGSRAESSSLSGRGGWEDMELGTHWEEEVGGRDSDTK